MTSKRLKVMVICLDGFDPDLFYQWRDQLPTLKQLAANGYFAPLESTIPAMTFPAWSSFLTGVNPGQHGIYDFTERIPGKYGVRFINASHRQKPSFLKIASESGLEVGSVGIPTTYPPEPLKGYQISGFDSPLPSKADRSYAYPPKIIDDINAKFGGYYFGNFNEGRIDAGWHRRVLAKLKQGIERKRVLFQYLIEKYPVDLGVFHIGETDTVGHHFWAYHDLRSPRHVSTNDEAIMSAIRDVYIQADSLVEAMINVANPESTIILSDHGMGGTSDRVLYLNSFLASKGLLHFTHSHALSRSSNILKKAGMRWIPYRWQQGLFHMAGGMIASNLESVNRFSGIEWEKTMAYSEELNYHPTISLNLKGREPGGIVKPQEVERLLLQIEDILYRWSDPVDGAPVVNKIHRREAIYAGSELDRSPDLILELNQPDGYSYALGRSTSVSGDVTWRTLNRKEFLGAKGATMNGSHRSKGILVVNASGRESSKPVNIKIVDVAPTILSLLDVPIPDWMEGKSYFEESKKCEGLFFDIRDKAPYSREEEDIIRKQLNNLGYLD